MNNQPQTRYIKSFSKGQITIPKEFRDAFGIGDEFWMKLSAQDGKIVVEPVKEEKKKNSREEIRGVPSRIVVGSPWVKELYAQFAPIREEARVAKYSEEEVNVAIDKAIKAVRKNND
ncbi:MAG TPA: AbrB/MazE/SpoVT family DNA-binding domain-containing protein [Xanthomonadales bacterium]|nr:AbrB/MazE/SpoVT family DNA-binding domain-containing protein [Xanthomonadales bacterium]